MYCQLCHIEASPTHNSSPGHQCARELAAVAVDRLCDYLEAEDSTEAGTSNEAKTDKTTTTPAAVGFCDSCNIVVPLTDIASHLQTRDHALALLKEETFEQLVDAYVGEANLQSTDPTHDGDFVDASEAVNKCRCRLCDLPVPRVFKSEHERGAWHRASRILTLASARRARDIISAEVGEPQDGHKFTGKMMKKLLKAYAGYDEIVEEPEPTVTQPKLTAKRYFTNVLSFLPYVGTFYTIIVDDTEFVTIQINNETLKIHVNNLNGLYNFEQDGGSTHCRLCDGFTTMFYSSVGDSDRQHVMSLGHIRNVLSPFASVHLIRKIDETHSICALCNLHIAPHFVDNHILKDTRHTVALSEALHRGKEYKENKEHLKLKIFMPQAQKQSNFMKANQFNNNNQNRWTLGVQQQPRHCTGTPFGSAQTTGFGGAQNTGFGCAQNAGFGNAQNTGFGAAQNAGFGSGQNAGFDNAQNAGFGSALTAGYGSVQNAGFGNAQNTGFSSAQTRVDNAQKSSFFGVKSSIFGVAQIPGQSSTISNGSALKNTTTFGSAGFWNNTTQSDIFGNAQHTLGAAQSAQGSAQPNPENTGQSQGIGSATFRNNTGSLSNTEASAAGFRAQNNSDIFGIAQNNTATFGVAQSDKFNAQPTPVNSKESQSISTEFGAAQYTAGPFGNAQNNGSGVLPQKKVYKKANSGQNNRRMFIVKRQDNMDGLQINKTNSRKPFMNYSSSSDSD